jgi:hypothetical protein
MEKDLKTIEFKSWLGNWEKEKSGNKNNTVRFTDDWGKDRWKNYKEATKIRLINTETGEAFVRVISDKTEYKNLVIISWRD